MESPNNIFTLQLFYFCALTKMKTFIFIFMSFRIYAFGHSFIDLFSSQNLESPVSHILSSRDFYLPSVLYKFFPVICLFQRMMLT